MLAVYQGEEILYLTLISSAKEEHDTPLGLYQIYDKSVAWDLGSRDWESDSYYFEKVPFVMHYAPRFALHSVFWHDDFGTPASHGCINLSVSDARYVFNAVSPELPDGWRYVKQSKQFLGTVVRIRYGQQSVPDKRLQP